MKRAIKIKAVLMLLSSAIVAVTGCGLYLIKQTLLVGNKEAFLEGLLHLLCYAGFLLCIVIPMLICSMAYAWIFFRRLWLKIGVVFLFLSFLASLVVVPHLIIRHEETKHYKRWHLGQEIQRLVDERIRIGTTIDEVETWLRSENIDFLYSEDTHELTAMVRKNHLLSLGAKRVEFPVFIQFHFGSDSDLRTYSVVTENYKTEYRKMNFLFKETP